MHTWHFENPNGLNINFSKIEQSNMVRYEHCIDKGIQGLCTQLNIRKWKTFKYGWIHIRLLSKCIIDFLNYNLPTLVIIHTHIPRVWECQHLLELYSKHTMGILTHPRFSKENVRAADNSNSGRRAGEWLLNHSGQAGSKGSALLFLVSK